MLRKIYSVLTVVLIASILTTGWIAYNSIDRFNKSSNMDKLQTVINIISEKLDEDKSFEEINNSIRTLFDSNNGNIRVTIINESGDVLFDNEANADEMDNHRYRPEVYRAIRDNTPSFTVRTSDTLGIEIYYLAQYFEDTKTVIRTAIPMVEYSSSIKEIGLRLAFILAISFAALFVIGMAAVNLITKPLLRLEKTAIQMSKGDYSARVPENGDKSSEISRLSDAFNQMAGKLQIVIINLEEKNSQMDIILNSIDSSILVADEYSGVIFMNRAAKEEFCDDSFSKEGVYPFISIVRSNEAERMLKKALEEEVQVTSNIKINTRKGNKIFTGIVCPVESANGKRVVFTLRDITQITQLQKMRSEFVANVTHELKTPLTSIRGFVDTLKNGAINNTEVAGRFLDIIDIEAERLHKLILDILTLSEIEDSGEDGEMENFDLYQLVDEIIVLLDEEASSKKVSLISGSGESEDSVNLQVKANRGRVKQILINLMENAIKYNSEGGKVLVEVSRKEDGSVDIVVTDTGSGIPSEHLTRIFERFYRVDKGRSKEQGGTGLGLSIVKHIAMLYNGSVKADSEIGKGSKFTVNLKI